MEDSLTGTRSRHQAIAILGLWMGHGHFPERLLPTDSQRAFVMDLVYGTLRNWRALQWVCDTFTKRRPSRKVYVALIVGAHQLLNMPDVPAFAAVHATVEALKADIPGMAGFVNAVLQRIAAQKEELREELQRQPLGVRLSHPDELLDRWIQNYGENEAIAIAAWNNQPSQATVVVLPAAAVDAAELLERWRQSGVEAQAHPTEPQAILLGYGQELERLEGFEEGWFTVQDSATLMATEMLAVEPGMAVLDACAAPGGKTARLAAAMKGRGRLVALDKSARRIGRLQSNMQRLGFDWVEVHTADARDMTLADKLGTFDRILLDVPCSNTGVLQRRPDARWRFSVKEMRNVVGQQRDLLTNSLPLLRPGGKLVYSTCSIEPEENAMLVAEVCGVLEGYTVEKSALVLPGIHHSDGAYATLIAR